MRVHFVVNPKAGRARCTKLVSAIRKEFRDHDTRISPCLPASGSDLDMVVAVGGDGTVNGVINSVARRGVPVGILPRGSANDLADALGIPKDFDRACAVIKSAHLARIDLISVNGTYFATCGGLGLAAAVAQRVNRWKCGANWRVRAARALGKKVYLLAALVELGRGRPPVRGRIVDNGHSRPGGWASLLVCNQPQFGGFSPTPTASNHDGALDLCEISPPTRRGRMLWISLQALRGRAQACPEVTQHRAAAVNIVTTRPVPFLGDGEILAVGRQFKIEVQPSALQVVVPDTGRASEDE